MSHKDPDIIFRGEVRNGKKIHDRPELYQMQLNDLEGKRFEEVIRPEHVPPSPNQRAYYRAGIIRMACMKSNFFAGYTEEEIHQELMRTLRAYIKNINDTDHEFTQEYSAFSKEQHALYIDDVLNWLAMHEIYPEPPENFKFNRYTK